MIHLTETDLQVFTSLGRSPTGPLLRDILRRMQESADTDCRTKEGAPLHRAQGEAELLRRLADYLDGAAAERLTQVDRQKILRRPVVADFQF